MSKLRFSSSKWSLLTKAYESSGRSSWISQGVVKSATINETPFAAKASADLKVEAGVRITRFSGDNVISRRLFDLGFTPGLTRRLEYRALLLDSFMFSVGSAEVVLCHSEASKVLVKP